MFYSFFFKIEKTEYAGIMAFKLNQPFTAAGTKALKAGLTGGQTGPANFRVILAFQTSESYKT